MSDYTPRILIVDDERHMCESLRLLLRRQGYHITTASSGKEAVQVLAGSEFDLILLDMVLPDLTGSHILDYVNSLNKDMLTIVITGNASIESAVNALRKGAYDYLKKPFEYEELLKRVGNALQQKKLAFEKRIISGKLVRTERLYQYLVDHSPDIIYILDARGCFSFVNIAVERLLGYTPASLYGVSLLDIVHSEDRERAAAYLSDQQHAIGEPVPIQIKLTLHGDGQRFKFFELTHTALNLALPDTEDETYVTYGIARDISYRKLLEDQLFQSKKMEALGSLASGIAHDFNNVLMGIMGYTSLMLADIGEDHPHYAKLHSIEQHVRSGANLTRQLLNFARGKSGDIKVININEVIDKTALMFGRTKKELTIVRQLDPALWPVAVDIGQMEQVFLNLYLNAWQAMPGGGTLSLATENRYLSGHKADLYRLPAGKYIAVSISDTGVGMDEDVVQRIFEPFFTTKESEHGTGLGLASVYNIIKHHNGSISVRSRKGHGTTFTLLLPATDMPVLREERPVGVLLPGTETVLLVDDEQTMLDVGTEILEAMGYTVITAQNGVEALRHYQNPEGSIDIVIVDLIMPQMNGEDLCRELRRINPDAKILLSTGYSIEGEFAASLQQVCDGFIQKPFAMTELSQKLRTILDRNTAQNNG
ncbi:MAG: response regulator [Desulfobacterota bacterium]|nr:response regulator [Thermodesulfobacteriota bacterium]